jgi:hypothetical protein
MLWKARKKGWGDEEEDVSSYCMTLRKREDTEPETESTTLHSVENSL